MEQSSLAHFEHGLPLLAKLDLLRFLDAYTRLQADPNSPTALLEMLTILRSVAEGRLLRKISATHRASVEELMASESDPSVFAKLEAEAALRSPEEAIKDTMAFFGSLGFSAHDIPGSSGLAEGNPGELSPAGSQ